MKRALGLLLGGLLIGAAVSALFAVGSALFGQGGELLGGLAFGALLAPGVTLATLTLGTLERRLRGGAPPRPASGGRLVGRVLATGAALAALSGLCTGALLAVLSAFGLLLGASSSVGTTLAVGVPMFGLIGLGLGLLYGVIYALIPVAGALYVWLTHTLDRRTERSTP